MKKLFLLLIVLPGCMSLLDFKKDVAIAEDITNDVVKEETGVELNLGPEHQVKK